MERDFAAVLDSIADIGIELPNARGRKAAPLVWGEPFSLTHEHLLEMLQAPAGAQRASASQLQLRSRHHKLAQLLATGMSEGEAAIMTGYSGSRISILKADPAFKELLEYYRDNDSRMSLEVQERMRQIASESLEEIQHRLDEDTDSFTNAELIKLAEGMLDRTGHGKSSTLNVNVGPSDALLQRLREQHNSESDATVRTIEHRLTERRDGALIAHEPFDFAGPSPAGEGVHGISDRNATGEVEAAEEIEVAED